MMENLSTVINCLIASCFILKYWESEAKENTEGKKLLEEKEENLKEILNLFPSAILFYNEKDGIIYKNKYFNEIMQDAVLKLEKKLHKEDLPLAKKRSVHRLKSVFQNSIEADSLSGRTGEELLSNFVNKDERFITLSEDLKKL